MHPSIRRFLSPHRSKPQSRRRVSLISSASLPGEVVSSQQVRVKTAFQVGLSYQTPWRKGLQDWNPDQLIEKVREVSAADSGMYSILSLHLLASPTQGGEPIVPKRGDHFRRKCCRDGLSGYSYIPVSVGETTRYSLIPQLLQTEYKVRATRNLGSEKHRHPSARSRKFPEKNREESIF